MKTLYIDCQMGAAGDMLCGALLELAPDKAAALAELNGMNVPGVEFKLEAAEKCGLAAAHLSVKVHGGEEGDAHHHHHGHSHRSLADVLHIIDGLSISASARARAAKVYESIAAAESRAHARPVGEVHFHEVGAMDAVADVAAFCHLAEKLAPDEIAASPVHVGCGSVECAHGTLPVPAPATAFLLAGIPTYSDGATAGELCTPTGAALLKQFVTSFGPQPLMRVEAIGCGAGRKDFPRANVVRAFFGERLDADGANRADGSDGENGEICEIEFNVDDMTGEDLAYASDRLFAAGAKDVSFTQIIMKKGRPGTLVSVMCEPHDRAAVVKAAFAHTSTLGMRETLCRRYTLERTVETAAVAGGMTVRRKCARGFGVEKSKWEADDLAGFATRTGATLAEARGRLEAFRPC